MTHLPILRHGVPYRSVDVATVVHHRTREPFVRVSQANAGLIRRDLLRQEEARAELARLPARELLDMAARAAQIFMEGTLPLDPVDGVTQTPQQYVEQVSATTGLPHVLVRRNMAKIHGVLAKMGDVIAGLTRGLDPSVFDSGVGEADGHLFSFYPRGHSLGVVLPNNSPGVHSLWVPAIGMKTPLVLKPGSSEPWTPYRIAFALMEAGVPRSAFSLYPADHAAGGELLRNTGRGMFFGDAAAARRFRSDPRIEVHGPGYSKVVVGDDRVDGWRDWLDVVATSVSDNGGRSCVNASGLWVTRHAPEIARALAERLVRIVPRPADDEQALLAPFADPSVPSRIAEMIDADLRVPGAVDVTAELRGGGRVVTNADGTYLLPTVILCDGPDHPLANREFMFPFVSVVPVAEEALPDVLGPSLVVTLISDNAVLRDRFLRSPHVDRFNIGAIPTNQIGWDQPHEGNLFDHLYGRRAIQRVA
ncbi:MAG TPA: aldehyde dehydrogenase family protein [Vicinamibacterales bacterium]